MSTRLGNVVNALADGVTCHWYRPLRNIVCHAGLLTKDTVPPSGLSRGSDLLHRRVTQCVKIPNITHASGNNQSTDTDTTYGSHSMKVDVSKEDNSMYR